MNTLAIVPSLTHNRSMRLRPTSTLGAGALASLLLVSHRAVVTVGAQPSRPSAALSSDPPSLEEPRRGPGRSGLQLTGIVLPQCSESDELPVRVEGTRLLVTKRDGSLASQDELVRAFLVARDGDRLVERFRIDSIEPFTSAATGDILMYAFSALDPETGSWIRLCLPDFEGKQRGFPLSGYWDSEGRHVPSDEAFLITCTSGAIGKCVMFGYLPWRKGPGDVSLWEYHQACTRMIRADYCGHDVGHTRNGTLVEIWDRIGIQVDSQAPGLTFEAAWTVDGALCVARTRLSDEATLRDIEKECPERLSGRIGPEACREAFDDPRVFFLNRSLPP